MKLFYWKINRLKMNKIKEKIEKYKIRLHDNFILKNVNYARIIVETRLLDISMNSLHGSIEDVYLFLKEAQLSIAYTGEHNVKLQFDSEYGSTDFYFVEERLENDEEYNLRISCETQKAEKRLEEYLTRIVTSIDKRKGEALTKQESDFKKLIQWY